MPSMKVLSYECFMEYVNTFSEFNRLSIKDKFSTLLRVWYLLRHHNTKDNGGNGWVSRTDALYILGRLYGENRPREILKSGEGFWWKVDGVGYKLFGIETIAKRIKNKPGYRVKVPISAFENKIQDFRAYAYATYFSHASSEYNNNKGMPISRATLSDLFGITVPTQIEYEKIAKVKAKPRRAYEDIPCFDGENYMPEEKALNDYQASHDGYYKFSDIDGDGKKEAVYQITNLYYVDSVVYMSNENKRVKNIGRSDQRDGASHYLNYRMYFDHIKQLKKIKNKKSVHEYSYVEDKNLSKKWGNPIHKKIRN